MINLHIAQSHGEDYETIYNLDLPIEHAKEIIDKFVGETGIVISINGKIYK